MFFEEYSHRGVCSIFTDEGVSIVKSEFEILLGETYSFMFDSCIQEHYREFFAGTHFEIAVRLENILLPILQPLESNQSLKHSWCAGIPFLFVISRCFWKSGRINFRSF